MFDVIEYCFNALASRAEVVEWLSELVSQASTERDRGNVGAGPIEAALSHDLDLARALEKRVNPAKLRSVLAHVWLDDADPDVREWHDDFMVRVDDGESLDRDD